MNSQYNIVIFNSPLYRDQYDDQEDHLPPLGQGYILSKLREAGIESRLIDCIYEHWGISQITDFINNGDFPNIGFNIFSVNKEIVREILAGITRPVNIYLGGKVVEHLWREIIQWKHISPITFIVGEGELIFPDLIKNTCIEKPVYCGADYKVYLVNKYSNYYPHDLDRVILDRTIFKGRETYNRFNQLEGCIVASRGCIFNCTFCGGSKAANPYITPRTRSSESLDEEIQQMLQICPGLQSIRVLDDLFLRDRNSIIKACHLFKRYPNLSWRCMAHITSFLHNFDLIPLMQQSGCREVFVGIESGSDLVRRNIKKVGTVENVKEVISALLQGGINTKGYFICGFPGETESQILETVRLAEELQALSMRTIGDFRATAFQFRPYHGTEIYRKLFHDGDITHYANSCNLVSARRQYNFSAGNFSGVSEERLEEYIKKINSLESTNDFGYKKM